MIHVSIYMEEYEDTVSPHLVAPSTGTIILPVRRNIDLLQTKLIVNSVHHPFSD